MTLLVSLGTAGCVEPDSVVSAAFLAQVLADWLFVS